MGSVPAKSDPMIRFPSEQLSGTRQDEQMKSQRRISRVERSAQGRRLAKLKIHWGRPTAETSEVVWELLSPSLGVCTPDLASDEATATQALVVKANLLSWDRPS